MVNAQSSEARPRRRMALALLATTAIAALLGGCTQTGLPFLDNSEQAKLSTTDAIGAVAQWSGAYAKDPQDPKNALGYASSLKALGSRDRALEVLTAGYRANPNNGEIAAELGRLALDMGRLDIAQQTLKVAEAQGVRDWKTLSAQGTLRAKQGQHAEAQQYFLAALQQEPDAVSVINNLALSYALDGKADKSEELLRKAVASGHDDKRVRQNLALVLGLQGKFEEARQVASVDMTEQEAKSSMSYLRNMLSNSTQVAAGDDDPAGADWQPFADNDAKGDKIESPSSAAPQRKTASGVPPATSVKQKVAGTETLITPVSATPAQAQAATPTSSAAQGGPASLLRTDTN